MRWWPRSPANRSPPPSTSARPFVSPLLGRGAGRSTSRRHERTGRTMELTGLVGWRGMVGSVLLERMAAEGDFGLIEPLFFSTSDKGGRAPAHARNETAPAGRLRPRGAQALPDHHHRAGRRVHQGRLPAPARRRLERLLDRRRQDAAHAGRRGHHPRPGQPVGHRRGARARRAQLHRRQLHGEHAC